MMPDREAPIYRVSAREGKFEVLNDTGSVVLVCRDEPTAANYAVLLCDAFQHGYKSGYRDGKTGGNRGRDS